MTVPLKVLRLRDVCTRVGLARTSIYRLVQGGAFPAPIKLSERATGWYEHLIEEWLRERLVASNAPDKVERNRKITTNESGGCRHTVES